MRNSAFLLRFLNQLSSIGAGEIGFQRLSPEDGEEWLELWGSGVLEKDASQRIRFAVCSVREPESDGGTRSGDPSPILDALDGCLRESRSKHPQTPLLVLARPASYWARSHAWLLGEYLAERDLPFWVDLHDKHPAHLVDWCRSIYACGLACDRLVLQIGGSVEPEDLPFLQRSGAWLLCHSPGQFVGVLQQV